MFGRSTRKGLVHITRTPVSFRSREKGGPGVRKPRRTTKDRSAEPKLAIIPGTIGCPGLIRGCYFHRRVLAILPEKAMPPHYLGEVGDMPEIGNKSPVMLMFGVFVRRGRTGDTVDGGSVSVEFAASGKSPIRASDGGRSSCSL